MVGIRISVANSPKLTYVSTNMGSTDEVFHQSVIRLITDSRPNTYKDTERVKGHLDFPVPGHTPYLKERLCNGRTFKFDCPLAAHD